MTRETIDEAFGFLESHGFSRSDVASVAARQIVAGWASSRVTIEASYNDRDGFDTGLVFTAHAEATVSVDTLISALRVEDGRRAQSATEVLGEQVRWLHAHIQKVFEAPSSVAADCQALRFYHGGSWQPEWGEAIAMDAAARQVERLRLERLRGYFGPIQRAA